MKECSFRRTMRSFVKVFDAMNIILIFFICGETFLPFFLLLDLDSNFYFLILLQSDDACCNSCEEVREAYRKKGWAMSDPEIIDQVCSRAFRNV